MIPAEERHVLILYYSLGFACSFPFIFVAWWLHQTVLFVLPTIFSVGFGSMIVALVVSGKNKKGKR